MDQALSIDILRRRGRQRLAAGALAFAALACAAWGLNRVLRPSVAGADVAIAEVRRGAVDNTVDAAGVVVPVHEEVVSSPGASRVAKVHAKPGQQVQEGELLLELDDREIRLALESFKEQLAQQDNRILVLSQEMEQKLKQTRSSIELLEIDPRAALAALEGSNAASFDLVLQDMNFSLQTSGEEGMDLLGRIKAAHPNLPVLLMTAWGSIALAVRGVKAGAANFFTKPWDNAQLIALIEATLELAAPSSAKAHAGTRAALDARHDFSGIVGEHPKLLKVLETIAQVAGTRAPVLILGESGTGKELVADAIHRNSPRGRAPIVKINMGAIATTLFESELFGHVRGAFTDARADRKGHIAAAHGGTLFLDEIGELLRGDQVKLLRVLQDGRYQPVGASRVEQADVRVVSATNRELAELVASGEFREDLFYRLNLITIRLPPLRERRSDIALLARHIAARVALDYGLGEVALAPSALEWLTAQSWPGNIRQLKQTLERTLLLAGKAQLTQADFIATSAVDEGAPGSSRLGVDGMTLEQVEKLMIEQALRQHSGNISRVAKALGLSRTALYRRLERHGLGNGIAIEDRLHNDFDA